MRGREFLTSVKRLAKVTSRPKRQEAFMLIKISLLGVAVVGIIGYLIRILFFFVGLSPE
ncbi:protein translocase SEC61 complex subunit gamma [[Eubacterium] cellulosolvens]